MKRKIISLLLLITIIFSLSGCFFKEPVLVNERILKYTDKEVINESNSFTLEDTSLSLYENEGDDTVSYVDIEEFTSLLGGGLQNYNIFKEDTLLLDYRQVVPDDIVDIVGAEVLIFQIEFDHESNIVFTSNLDLFTRLNLVHSISANETMELIEMERNDVFTGISIDLDNYDFDILYENDHYYLPFYLANLFLTGASINFYETDDAIVLFDYGVETEQIREHYTSSSKTVDDVKEATNNYLALYFDYFYGLKEEKEIDSFSTYIAEFELEDQNTFIDHHESISNFLVSLDDLHTRILDTGYLLPEYELKDNFIDDGKVETYSIAYQTNECIVYPEDILYEEVEEGIHLIKIPGFTFDTGTEIEDYIEFIDEGDYVIIDLSCNTGGSLQGVVESLFHFTDLPIPVRHINSKTNQIVEEFYENDSNSLDANLFVVTSGVTYSAAHVFASIVSDLEIGRVIGNPTLGGSCALAFTVLPNGMIISNSSYMTFVDEEFQIEDDGIEVDITYQLPIRNEKIAKDIDSYFSIGTRYTVQVRDFSSESRIVFDISMQDDVIAPIEYVLTVSNDLGDVIYTETYYDHFTLRVNFDDVLINYNIELTAKYIYDSITYDEVIYYQEAQD